MKSDKFIYDDSGVEIPRGHLPVIITSLRREADAFRRVRMDVAADYRKQLADDLEALYGS